VRSGLRQAPAHRAFEELPVAGSLGPVGLVLGSFAGFGTDHVELFDDAGARRRRGSAKRLSKKERVSAGAGEGAAPPF